MNESNRALIHRWFEEVWNQGRESTIDELLAATGIAYGLADTDATIQGPAQFKPFVRNLRGAFPDLRISIEDTITEGDKAIVRIVLEGNQKGSKMDVPPTSPIRRIRDLVVVVI